MFNTQNVATLLSKLLNAKPTKYFTVMTFDVGTNCLLMSEKNLFTPKRQLAAIIAVWQSLINYGAILYGTNLSHETITL